MFVGLRYAVKTLDIAVAALYNIMVDKSTSGFIMENVFENFTIAIMRINKLIQKIKLKEIDRYGLKAIHVMCAYYLLANPDGLTASELVKLTLEDKGAISRALTSMRDKGFICYNSDTYNAKIVLTESGKVFAESLLARADSAVEAGGAQMTETERVEFYKTLYGIADRLQAYYETLKDKKDRE